MGDSSLSLEENIFELLSEAKKLESSGGSFIEAATKYHESVYLMKRYIQRLPMTASEEPKRTLFREQIKHYENKANNLVLRPGEKIDSGDVCGVDLDAMSTIDPGKGVQRDELSKATNQQYVSRILRLVNQANRKLATALECDESSLSSSAGVQTVIDAYMEAAEGYLGALQMAEKHSGASHELHQIASAIKKRLNGALNRIEEIKHGKNGKSQTQQHSNQQQNTKIPDPSKSLTKEEVSVLKESSTTVSGLFLPWQDEDALELYNQTVHAVKHPQSISSRFKDPAGFLKLSDKQIPHFHIWARPDEIVRLRQQSGLRRGPMQRPVLINSVTPYTIKQQFVTDCSFIASLCVTATLERRMKRPIITSSIYPQTTAQQPIYNPIGKYMVKLWLNGVARCVVIDDLLPIDQYGNLLCSLTTDAATSPYLELWVCLIEKAYMKLCGGYDFPGSNSGVDLFSLTGWIPERVHFAKSVDKVRDFEQPPERAWERIVSAFSFGDCLITVSSHLSLPGDVADKLGLVLGHAYAVLAVIETKSGLRMLQLKNPWAHKRWKGRFSVHDEVWRDKSLCAELQYCPDTTASHDDGVFWICWEDILKVCALPIESQTLLQCLLD
mmetsp:Transcript_3130/g.8823  ORF Transcript_3130/g.8823 Transcript_3130/m.8823 type:complete len:612 (-) Transcript_3130:1098-2933(-)